MKRIRREHFLCFILSLSTAGLIGCGGLPVNSTTPPSFTPPSSTIATSCLLKRGTVITVGGRTLCRLNIAVASGVSYQFTGGNPGSPSGLPVLTPTNPSGGTGMALNFRVLPGDRLTFSGLSQWGAISIDTTSALGGFFHFTTVTSNCNLANGDGLKSDGSPLPQNGGLNQGLVVSDQKQVYFLGSGGSTMIQNSGELRLGINASGNNQGCGTIQITSLQVERCLDSNDSPQSCS